jgi:putative inorganic carbon (HCO3(-)) transporter
MLSILLTLIFIRPLISSLAFPCVNYFYSIILAVFLAGWILFKFKEVFLKNTKGALWPLLSFFLALLISLFFSQNRLHSRAELYKYLTGMLLLLIGASLSERNKKQAINIMVLSGVVIAALAIYQYFFGFQHVLDYLKRHDITTAFTLDYIQRKRVFFPFVTPNILAGYLAMVIPLALMNKYRIFVLTPLFIALLLTKSLGGILSLLAAMTLYLFLGQEKQWSKSFMLLCGVLAVGGIVLALRIAAAAAHTHPLFSTAMRLDYWRQAIAVIQASPLVGVGLGNFNLPQARYAHNSYLQIWAEMGILGIISFLWLIFTILKGALPRLAGSSEIKQKTALLAAAVAFLVHNFIDFGFFLPEVSLIWWLILGLYLKTRDTLH